MIFGCYSTERLLTGSSGHLKSRSGILRRFNT